MIARNLLVAGAAVFALAHVTAPVDTKAVDRCAAEDSPAWSWSQCGNHKRGVVLTASRPRVVGPCAFARLDRRGRIDWSQTPRLRGDEVARRYGCKAVTR